MVGSQLVVICWEVMDTVGGGAWLEEVGHGGMPLKVTPGPWSCSLSASYLQ
jgi:hypothetical protein